MTEAIIIGCIFLGGIFSQNSMHVDKLALLVNNGYEQAVCDHKVIWVKIDKFYDINLVK